MIKSHFHIHMHASSVSVSWTTCTYSYLPFIIPKKLVQPVWICIIVNITYIMKALHLKAIAHPLPTLATVYLHYVPQPSHQTWVLSWVLADSSRLFSPIVLHELFLPHVLPRSPDSFYPYSDVPKILFLIFTGPKTQSVSCLVFPIHEYLTPHSHRCAPFAETAIVIYCLSFPD